MPKYGGSTIVVGFAGQSVGLKRKGIERADTHARYESQQRS